VQAAEAHAEELGRHEIRAGLGPAAARRAAEGDEGPVVLLRGGGGGGGHDASAAQHTQHSCVRYMYAQWAWWQHAAPSSLLAAPAAATWHFNLACHCCWLRAWRMVAPSGSGLRCLMLMRDALDRLNDTTTAGDCSRHTHTSTSANSTHTQHTAAHSTQQQHDSSSCLAVCRLRQSSLQCPELARDP
jgi:hypothetical protein